MKAITVGRLEDNDVVINDEYASRHHLRIVQHDDGSYTLTDCGSTNGTFVNGQRVYGDVKLLPNDIVRVGKTILQWNDHFGSEPLQDSKMKEICRNAAEFEMFMNRCDFDSFNDLMFVLPQLPFLRIHEGYVLDAFKDGIEDFGWEFRPYCRQGSAERIVGVTNNVKVAPILTFFNVPFTEEGIMQAWLLDNLSDFMPKFWHANYTCKTFVFNIENVMQKVHRRGVHAYAKIKSCDTNSLLPCVSIRSQEAFLEYAYWNDWSGLVKVKNKVVKDGATVRFHEPERKTLVEYHCNTIF